MSYEDKNLGLIFPTRTGESVGGGKEREMLDSIGAQNIRTKIYTHPDGTTTRLKTRGGFPEFVTDIPPSKINPEPQESREFCAVVKTLTPSNIEDGVRHYASTALPPAKIKYSNIPVSAWVRKDKPKFGSPIAYNVLPWRSKIGLSTPENFFDVVQICGNQLVINERNAFRGLDVKVSGIPSIAFPASIIEDLANGRSASYPTTAPSYRDNCALYISNETECYEFHTGGDGLSQAWDTSEVTSSLPALLTTFGTTVSNTITRGDVLVEQMGGGATSISGLWVSRFAWWMSHLLTNTEKNTLHASKISFPVSMYLPMEDEPSTGSSSDYVWKNPPNLPSRATIATVFKNRDIGINKPDPVDFYQWTYNYATTVEGAFEGHVEPVNASGFSQSNTLTWSNRKSKNDTYVIGYLAGDEVTLIRSGSSETNFSYIISNGSAYAFYDGGAVTTAGYSTTVPPKLTNAFGNDFWYVGQPVVEMANGLCMQHTNVANINSSYIVAPYGIPLVTVNASQRYDRITKTWTEYSYTPTAVDSYAAYLQSSSPANSPIGSNRFTLAAANFQGEQYFYQPVNLYGSYTRSGVLHEEPSVDMDSASLLAVCRDYIFFDPLNSVEVYIETTVEASGVGLSGTGRTTLRLCVIARGVEHRIFLCDRFGDGVYIGTTSVTGVALNSGKHPEYMQPVSSPAAFSPISHQGLFKYIAYTTREEEEAGVPRRFVLSIPLYIRRYVHMDEITTVTPPSECFTVVAYNASELVQLGGGSGIFVHDTPTTVFHVHVSHDGERDFVAEVLPKGVSNDGADLHFAELYRV